MCTHMVYIDIKPERYLMRQGKKRLAVDIPIEVHKQLAELAQRHNITITKLILKLITIKLIKDEIINDV